MSDQTEADVIQREIPELEAEGYEVYLRPNRALLPTFFGDYVPDIVARKPDKNLAIEVVQESRQTEQRLEQIAHLFDGQKEWELRIVWIAPRTPRRALEVQSVSTIRRRIGEVRRLLDERQFGPGLLLAWAAFEAIARALSTAQFKRPQTPGRLVEVLATEGFLTPTEADRLRQLAEKRNRFVHGELQVRVTKVELQAFARTLENLLEMIGREHVPAA